MARYFHLYADGKRIREIDVDEYLEITRKNYHSKRSKRVVWVRKDYIGISKGIWYAKVPLRQLLEVLKVCGVIKNEG